MLYLNCVSYIHPNKDLLFENISFSLNKGDKVALIGNNGVGKSTLLKIIAAELKPSSGTLILDSRAYRIPQVYGQLNHQSIAQSLNIEKKLHAYKEILLGNTSEKNYAMLDDDWCIETRCQETMAYWHLADLDFEQKLGSLSGGQKTKVFLAGISIHQPELVLLDEPSNHLDHDGKKLLYDFIESTKSTLLVVSHDRNLLKLLGTTFELQKNGIKSFGGNYDFYVDQKQLENQALQQNILHQEKSLRTARAKERKTLERQQKLNNRGKKKQVKAGMPKTMMAKMKNDAEKSSSKLKGVHSGKIGGIRKELHELRASLPEVDQMRFGFDHSKLHKGKILFAADGINFSYASDPLWPENLSLKVLSGQRLMLKGKNGSGKTTLIKLLLGQLEPCCGSLYRSFNRAVYIDQDYSLIDIQMNLYEQAQAFNACSLPEHDVKIRLDRFLFNREQWDKPCSTLSGGERMRLMLCCLNIANKAPDLIILDEPTNNLDIQNMEILAAAIHEYQGTLLVVSHDKVFLKEVSVDRTLQL